MSSVSAICTRTSKFRLISFGSPLEWLYLKGRQEVGGIIRGVTPHPFLFTGLLQPVFWPAL
jgi:hypothetical protein